MALWGGGDRRQGVEVVEGLGGAVGRRRSSAGLRGGRGPGWRCGGAKVSLVAHW